MSNNIKNLKPIRVIPKYMDLSGNTLFTLLDGGEKVSYRTEESSNFSTSQFSIKADPPNGVDTLIHPVIYQEVEFELTYTSAVHNQGVNRRIFDTDDGLEFGNPIIDAPRDYPLAKIINSAEIRINGSSITTNLNDYFDGLTYFNNCLNEKKGILSLGPVQHDKSNEYSDNYLSNRSPFAKYSDNVREIPRSTFFEIVSNPTVATANSGVAKAKIKIIEPIFVSPFYYQGICISNVKTFEYRAQFGNLYRLACRSSTNGNPGLPPLTIDSISFKVLSNPKLHFKYITPKKLMKIPEELSYRHFHFEPIKNDIGVVNAGLNKKVNLNSTDISYIPKMIMLFADEKVSEKEGLTGLGKTNTFKSLPISIRIGFKNSDNPLVSAEPLQLYRLSVQNGFEYSYQEWLKLGAPVMINPAKDFGLDDTTSPGVLDKTQLRVEYEFKNVSKRNIDFRVVTYLIYDGVATISKKGNFFENFGVASKDDVLKLSESKSLLEDEYKRKFVGGFLPLDILRLIRKGVQIGAPIANKVANVAESLGLGRVKKRKKGGAVTSSTRRTGGTRIGGKSISSKKLMKLMMQNYK